MQYSMSTVMKKIWKCLYKYKL